MAIILNFIIDTSHVNAGHMTMSIMNGMKYQCGNQTCTSFLTTILSHVRHCQIICMDNIACSALVFQQSSRQCNLYDSTIRVNGTLIVDPESITMIVTIDERYIAGKPKINISSVYYLYLDINLNVPSF